MLECWPWLASWPAQLRENGPEGVIFYHDGCWEGQPMLSNLPGAFQLQESGNSSCWYRAHSSLGMTLISANTLAFGLIGKQTEWNYKKFFGDMNLVFRSKVALLGYWIYMFRILVWVYHTITYMKEDTKLLVHTYTSRTVHCNKRSKRFCPWLLPAVWEQTPSKQLSRERTPVRQSLSRRHSPKLLS